MKKLIVPASLLLALTAGCAAPNGGSDKSGDGAERAVIASLPADVQERSRVDFGGTLELLGWDLDAKQASPGSTLHLRLYLRSTKRLSAGWDLVSELVGPESDQPAADAAQKAALSPSEFRPGAIYAVEQDVSVPADVTAPTLTLTVSLTHEPVQVAGAEVEGLSSLRLPILSGLSDGQDRAIIARLATGAGSGEKRGKGSRRRPDERRLPGDRGPRPALSAMRRALPPPMPSAMVQKERP